MRFGLLFAMLVSLTAAKCVGVRPDLAMGALQAGDYTALIEGCGNQLVPGYTYCRVSEGDASGMPLTFVGPPAICKRDDACVFFDVYFPNGEPTYSDHIPKGETDRSIKWTDLIKRDHFTKGDRGFWPYIYTIHWIDMDGNEMVSKSEGEIRLRVLDADYVPLHNSKENPNFVWHWAQGNQEVKLTTGMRTYVGKR